MGTRVIAAQAWKEDLQLTRTYRIAGESISSAENVFILLRNSKGQTGLGSACPMPEVCGEQLEDTLAALKQSAQTLHGIDIADPGKALQELDELLLPTPAARAAVDMACLDLISSVNEIPLADYLGRTHSEMATSVTIGIGEEAAVREQLSAHLKNGFRAIKVKIGDDVIHDIAIVHKLREWGGSDFRLRVDANQGYDQQAMKKFLISTAGLNIELIEQPFKAPAAAAMLALSEPVRALCMADEDLINEDDASTLIPGKPYGVWNIKLMKSGGITVSRRIAAQAASAGIQVMWGCNDESRVSISAGLHAAFSSRATQFLDLDGAFDIARDIVEGGFTVQDGKLRLTDAPGLGVRLK